MVYNPIYKDTYYITNSSDLSYTINYDGQVIFSGRARKGPGQTQLKININKVCQDYLSQNIDAIFAGASSEANPDAMGDFVLKNALGTTLETYRFLYCYDYDYDWAGQTSVSISEPICDTYAAGMKVLNTTVGSTGVTTTASSPIHTAGCVKYGLYYVGARGGWNSFAIQGSAIKKDTITPYQMDKTFNNNTREYEAFRFISEIKTSYELNTHYLSDEEAANLSKNLVGSNMVYLHNLMDGTIRPVIITDTQVTYQTYQTNGKKMAQYKINIVESQSKIRR